MTMEALFAGLQNQHLRIPVAHLELVRQFTMTGQPEREGNRDNIPFNRYIDIWWLALCIGVQEGRRTELETNDWHQFIRAGEVLPSNPWRVFQLQLLAVGATNSTEILSNPAELIRLANEYAATGLPIVLDELLGSAVPIWAVTEYFSKRLIV